MAKQQQPWDRVYDQIRVTRSSDSICVPRAVPADLDALETQLGSRLPKSYRAFMERFGAGELVDWIRLLRVTPGRHELSSVADWTKFRWYLSRRFPGLYSNEDWLTSIVYFGSDVGGDCYAWDPAAKTRPRLPEYRIYYIAKLSEERPRHVADSFQEFVAWTETHTRSWRDADPEIRREPGVEFTPYHLRAKKKPLKRDAKAWLAANGHTARDLVRAIRAGRADAFPILADALEEAGCTNRDVLDSCRTGDPAIDGAWVLRVLTGDHATGPA